MKQWVPLVLVGLMGALVLFAGLQACDNNSPSPPGDLATPGDLLTTGDASNNKDLTTGGDLSTAGKHKAACQNICQCLITSLDLTTCTSDCLTNAGSSFGSFFGQSMTDGCYDCIAGSSCAQLMGAGSCFASATTCP